ncbi:MAG: pyocin knob domain-containing protein [Muribaculaceae bacterium]|nr:pyocin knob domain-containing protein [Muribaculaceae bacterium]
MSEAKILTETALAAISPNTIMYRGYLSGDLNDVRQTGMYLCYNSTLTNAPLSHPFYFVLVFNISGRIIQQAISSTGEYVYQRSLWDNVWYPWRFIKFQSF